MRQMTHILLAATIVFAAATASSCEKQPQKGKVEVESINIIPGKSELEIGEETTLTANVRTKDGTEAKVTWSVENPEILSITQDGTVKGLKEGQTNAVAKAGEASAVCPLKVKSDLKLEASDKRLYWGGTLLVKPVHKTSGEAREVQWQISYPEMEEGYAAQSFIGEENNELQAMPLTEKSTGNYAFKNYKIRLTATAKDNGSTASYETTIYWWDIKVYKNLTGGLAEPDHVFRSGDNIYLFFPTIGNNVSAKDLGLTIQTDANVLRQFDDDTSVYTTFLVKDNISTETTDVTIECSKGLAVTREIKIKVRK